jgi:hypothetical protein
MMNKKSFNNVDATTPKKKKQSEQMLFKAIKINKNVIN